MISVIVPAFDAEETLRRCIDSIRTQTYPNLEVLIINDGSTDRTGAIADEIATEDSRVMVLHQENKGVSAARNLGLENAKGSLIGFADSDDQVDPDMYDVLYRNMAMHDADIAHCGFALVTPERTIPFYGTEKVLLQTKEDALINLLRGYPFEPSSCTKLYRKKVLQGVYFHTDIRFNEDLLFNVEAFKNARNIVFQDVMGYRYIFNPSSASKSTESYVIQQNVLLAANEIRKTLQEVIGSDAVNIFFTGKLIAILQALYSIGKSESTLAIEVKKLLKETENGSLTIRLRYLKYTLLYFYPGYQVIRWVYDRMYGDRKRW